MIDLVLAALRWIGRAILVAVSLVLLVLVVIFGLDLVSPGPPRGGELVALFEADRPRWRSAMARLLEYWFQDSRFDLDSFADHVGVSRATMWDWHRAEPGVFRPWEEDA